VILLKADERDELLIRLDGRTKHACELTEKQEKHLMVLNDRTLKLEMNVDRNHNRITRLEDMMSKLIESGVPLRLNKKQVIGGSSIISVIIAIAIALGTLAGWW